MYRYIAECNCTVRVSHSRSQYVREGAEYLSPIPVDNHHLRLVGGSPSEDTQQPEGSGSILLDVLNAVPNKLRLLDVAQYLGIKDIGEKNTRKDIMSAIMDVLEDDEEESKQVIDYLSK